MKMSYNVSGAAATIAAAAFLVLAPAGALAQGKYPERAIRLVIPFAPGGNTDIVGRRFAAKLTPLIGRQVVADNKSGASGSIGTAEVARAKPDGYTLVIGTVSTHSLNPLTMANIAYDPVKDFAYIDVIGLTPMGIGVHPTIARTLPELVKRVKAAPGKFSYGSCGTGSICHLTGELFKKQAGGLDIIHVPYRSSGQSVTEVVAGQIPILAGTFSSMVTHHRSGQVRILVVCNDKRSSSEPSVPSAPEVGMKEMLAYTYAVFAAPAGTPAAIVTQLHQATAKAMSEPAFQKELEALTVEPMMDSDPAKATQMIRTELAKWGSIVKEAGIKQE
ncbi:MAG: tripartite tricarboxylate transporter substrate binding protein [Burkholderiales bacterium]|nr:tripartite tricarboxylate transporter substrate binding protein [Burkholderiales bacterium]